MIPISPDDFARNPTISDDRHDLIARLISRAAYGEINEVPEVDIPISIREARLFTQVQAGLGSCSGSLDICWIRLRLSTTAEQRLSYQRLIEALASMHGLEDYRQGAILCSENKARAQASKEKARAEKALMDWRSPWLSEGPPTDDPEPLVMERYPLDGPL